MKSLPIATALAFLSGCAASPCQLCGTWRSNEEMTVADVRAHSNELPEKAVAFLTKPGYFGRLTIETNEKTSRSYFPDEDDSSQVWPYKVISSKDGSITIKTYSELTKIWDALVVELDGNCFSVEVPGFPFREHFCRVEGLPNNSLKADGVDGPKH